MATTGVIGDVHLDLTGLVALLEGPLGACDAYVVTGDVLDRGPADPAVVLDLLIGHPNTHVLCGNHELVYLGGPRYGGMFEERCAPLAPVLRDLVIDGHLRAAISIDGVLCTHGGVSKDWWRHHTGQHEAQQTAVELNRLLLRGVAKRDFRHPIFAALDSDEPGPFWASIRDDLIDGGTPPFDQVVGHVPLAEGWHHVDGGGRVQSVCRERSAEGEAGIGYVILDGLPS